MPKILDISVPIYEGMPIFPGDPVVQIQPETRIARGDAWNSSFIHLGTHLGTHVDPPYHYFNEGAKVDEIPLDYLVGPAHVASLEGVETIGAADLARLALPPGARRLLLKTNNSRLWEMHGFQKDYVALSLDAAEWLVQRGFVLAGIDYLSVEAFDAPEAAVHRTLLAAGVVLLEGLDLRAVPPGEYELICLPLKLRGGDGGPARVILIGN